MFHFIQHQSKEQRAMSNELAAVFSARCSLFTAQRTEFAEQGAKSIESDHRLTARCSLFTAQRTEFADA